MSGHHPPRPWALALYQRGSAATVKVLLALSRALAALKTENQALRQELGTAKAKIEELRCDRRSSRVSPFCS